MFIFDSVVLVVSVVLCVFAILACRNARSYRKTAEKVLLDSAATEQRSITNRAEARKLMEIADAKFEAVQRIETLLIHPRFALNLETGTVRALRADEQAATALEVETVEPDRNCRECHGRGWIGRQRESGRVLPCKCVRRAP